MELFVNGEREIIFYRKKKIVSNMLLYSFELLHDSPRKMLQ